MSVTGQSPRKGGFLEGATAEELGGEGCCGGSGPAGGGCCGEPAAPADAVESSSGCCGEPTAPSGADRSSSGCCG